VSWILLVRAIVVLSLGFAFLISADNRPILGNLLATYWLAGALLTFAWVRANRGHPRARLALIAGIVGVVAAVIGLTRAFIEDALSVDAALALIGATAVVIGTLRLVGAFRDGTDERPQRVRRVVLGLSEIAIGVIWIATDEMTRTVAAAMALWALVGGTIMLIDALSLRSRRRGPER
jgi:uncharacterized membrane protein HdeD (DUF308 family)